MTTPVANQHPDEQLFEAIKAGVDALPTGAKMVLNTAEFYGPLTDRIANLAMLSRFYEANPTYADKTILMVKGAGNVVTRKVDNSMENLRASVDMCNAALRGTKKIDVFQSARVDFDRTIEEAIRNMVVLKEEGKFDHLGLSETKAETLRRAHAVHPIAVVEIEVSIWSYEDRTKEVIETARELGVSIAAYSRVLGPLGHGFLTGQLKSMDDIPAGDFRRNFTRFKEHNLANANAICAFAEKQNITPAQLAIAWVARLGPHVLPLPGSSSKRRVLENLAGGDVVLGEDDLAEIAEIMKKYSVEGHRYFGTDEGASLWG
ncbi:aldo/keto reductase [Fomitopsis betulina]|nr:aldo/keto reductase [Fomitopsis betulina]